MGDQIIFSFICRVRESDNTICLTCSAAYCLASSVTFYCAHNFQIHSCIESNIGLVFNGPRHCWKLKIKHICQPTKLDIVATKYCQLRSFQNIMHIDTQNWTGIRQCRVLVWDWKSTKLHWSLMQPNIVYMIAPKIWPTLALIFSQRSLWMLNKNWLLAAKQMLKAFRATYDFKTISDYWIFFTFSSISLGNATSLYILK